MAAPRLTARACLGFSFENANPFLSHVNDPSSTAKRTRHETRGGGGSAWRHRPPIKDAVAVVTCSWRQPGGAERGGARFRMEARRGSCCGGCLLGPLSAFSVCVPFGPPSGLCYGPRGLTRGMALRTFLRCAVLLLYVHLLSSVDPGKEAAGGYGTVQHGTVKAFRTRTSRSARTGTVLDL